MILRDIAYGFGALVSSPIWGASLLRTGKYRTDWAGKLLGRVPEMPKEASDTQYTKRLLIHAVSVGEVMANRSLVSYLEEHAKHVQVVIATTTNTGFERALEVFGGRHHVVRYPLDFSLAVGRFLDTLKPDAVALTELEVWPNFVEACERRGIKVAVINGRLTERSYKRYRKVLPIVKGTFGRLSAAAVQTADYAERFKGLGVPADRVQILDTMKWDTANIADEVEGSEELAADLGIDRKKMTVVAGSTGPGEEKLLVKAVLSLRGVDINLVIVPRKPERFEEVAEIGDCVRRSENRDGKKVEREGKPDFYLVDTMGELRKAYALADVVVVGRSFNGLGGSDLIEPIALGKPVIMGFDYYNFADAVKAFDSKSGIVLCDKGVVGAVIKELLGSEKLRTKQAKAGREVIRERMGSTKRHAEMLLKLMG